MNWLNRAAQTRVDQLAALQSYQRAVSAYQEDFNGHAQRFLADVEAGKEGRKRRTETISPALKDMLTHLNLSIPEGGSVEQALLARKRKPEQDVHRSRTTVEDLLRVHHNNLPVNTEQLLETKSNADGDLLRFEQNIQKLRDSMDRLDVERVMEERDGAQGRFVARWAGDG
jgi:hypothetical protein